MRHRKRRKYGVEGLRASDTTSVFILRATKAVVVSYGCGLAVVRWEKGSGLNAGDSR